MANDDLISRYEKAYENYQNRRISWVEKFHAVVKEIPHVKYAKNITEKSIKRLQKEVWPKLTERTKKKARKEYERLYEEGAEGIYFPKPPYKPPTEHDYMEVPYQDILPRTVTPVPSNEEPDEDGYNPTVDSRAELQKWISLVITDVVISLPDKEIIGGVAERLEDYVYQAFWQAEHYLADVEYLQYLQDNTERFHDLALKAIHGYDSKGTIRYLEQGGETALPQFVTLLNFNKPITPEQSDQYNEASMFASTFEDMYG